jgi:cytochrome c oxidase assembly protein subunit 16
MHAHALTKNPHAMPPFKFPSKSSPLHQTLKKHPAYFGVPFLLIIVGASFALQTFTQIRYDLHDQKVTQVSCSVIFASPQY